MKEAYSNLAQFYDESMEVDYEEWVVYLLSLMLRYGHVPDRILDLGCGTANLTLPLARRGYSLTGVDLSKQMILEAEEKSAKEGFQIPFLIQDMRTLDLRNNHFTTVISGCDVLNYLITEEDLVASFRGVQRVLEPGGLWFFDLNSAYKLQQIYGSESYADLQDDFGYFWDNNYDWDLDICQMELTFFVKTLSGLYERKRETHKQKLWWPQQIKTVATANGFQLLACYNFLTTTRWNEQAERWQFILKKLA